MEISTDRQTQDSQKSSGPIYCRSFFAHDREKNATIAVHNFRHPQFREKITAAILEMLTRLPKPEEHLFLEPLPRLSTENRLQKFCGAPKVQATLDAISATLYQRARTLLEEDTQRTLEMDLPAANLLIPRQNVDSGFRRSILIDGEREQEERLRAEVDAKEK